MKKQSNFNSYTGNKFHWSVFIHHYVLQLPKQLATRATIKYKLLNKSKITDLKTIVASSHRQPQHYTFLRTEKKIRKFSTLPAIANYLFSSRSLPANLMNGWWWYNAQVKQ